MAQPERVSFICPQCSMQCGWDEKKKTYDAVLVSAEEGRLQYAHERCMDRD
jgi:hypothetical protein